MNARKKLLLSGGILLLAALVVWLLARPEAPPAPVESTAATAPPVETKIASLVRTDPAAPTTATKPRPPVAAPVFAEVRLEKEEVCEGEENLVTVRAHTTDGNDAFLHYT